MVRRRAGAPAGYCSPRCCAPAAAPGCRRTLDAVQLPLLCSMMPMVPSEEAVASIRPSSCGAQHTLLMDAECRLGADW